MGRTPCCDKTKVKKGPWTPEEDQTLKNYLHKYGTGGNWITLPQKAGLKRCGKSCRLRWLNYLRPDIKHGPFSPEEDNIIYTFYSKLGSRWSIIAAQLPGRTDNDVKNHWNSKLKKKLMVAAINNPISNIDDNMVAFKTTSSTSTSKIQLCLEAKDDAYSPNFPVLCTQTPPKVPFLADDCTEFTVSTEGSKFCSSSSTQPQEDSIISETTSFGTINNSMPWSDEYVEGLPMEMSTAFSYEIMSGIWPQETVLQSPYFTCQFIN